MERDGEGKESPRGCPAHMFSKPSAWRNLIEAMVWARGQGPLTVPSMSTQRGRVGHVELMVG